jgi:hypothetical protein
MIFTETPLGGAFVIVPEYYRDSGVSSHAFSPTQFRDSSDCSSPACRLPFHSREEVAPWSKVTFYQSVCE